MDLRSLSILVPRGPPSPQGEGFWGRLNSYDFKKIASNGITYLDFRKSMNEKNGKLLSACHFQKYMVY